MIACSFTALLSKKYGIKFIAAASMSIMALSGALILLSYSYPAFAGSYFLMYISNGMLEIELALIGSKIFVKNTGLMMNLSHFFYGMSSIIAPMIAVSLMQTHIAGHMLGWRGMYFAVLLTALIPLIPNSLCNYDQVEKINEHPIELKTLLRDKVLWLLVFIISFSVVAEMTTGGWLIDFLEKVYRWEPGRAAKMLSAFFLFFTISRLLVGGLTDRIGFALSFALFSGFGACCIFIALMTSEKSALFFALSGIGIAPIYPTVMAYITKKYNSNSELAITAIVTLLGAVNMVGNYLVGSVIEFFKTCDFQGRHSAINLARGLEAGYGAIGVCMALALISSIVLYYYTRSKNRLI
jgi:MFS family permease